MTIDSARDQIDAARARIDAALVRTDALRARFGPRRRDYRLPLVIAAAGLVAGYLLGRRAARRTPAVAGPAANGAGSPPAEPAMEVTTAVEVSRPQPAELDEIVPVGGAKA